MTGLRLPRLQAFAPPLVASAFAALAFVGIPNALASPPPGYQLVWHDEFSGSPGSQPNSSYWFYDTGYSIRNEEQETYTSSNAQIVADPNATDGSALDIFSTYNPAYSGAGEYDSSELNSIGLVQFMYGFYECRAKVPPGGPDYQGYWPAFWTGGDDYNTVGWPACGELDVMEHLCGPAPDLALQTLHGITTEGQSYQYGSYDYDAGQDLGNAYHLFQMLWTPGVVTFYTDGVETGSVSASQLASDQIWPYDNISNPQHLWINLAIGGAPGWNGNITSQTIFPGQYLVDYVRVYEPTNYSTWLYDPGFESGALSPCWNVYSPNGTGGAASIQSGATHSGSYFAAESSSSPYNVIISQTPQILPSGTYTLSAWVKSSGSQSTCQMYAKRYSKTDGSDYVGVTLPTTNTWTQISIPNIAVTTSECECGFYSIASANQWCNIDDVSLTPDYQTPAITSLTPGAGQVGNTITIDGANFMGVSQVKFNGTPAPDYTVDLASDQITVTVPSGATSGPVTVTNPAGTADSQAPLVVGSARFDFNAAGKDDLLWENSQTGQLVLWYMNGQSAQTYGPVFATVNPAWKVMGVADINGDGHPDLLWWNSKTGQMLFWEMNGTAQLNDGSVFATVPLPWQPVSMADFNGDGHPDILFQNPTTGALVVWYMNGESFVSSSGVFDTTQPNWRVAGTADFLGNGHPDILWENSKTGQILVWYMGGSGGTTIETAGSPFYTVPDTSWQIVSTGDTNGDGHPDITWHNSKTGATLVWLMGGASGTTIESAGSAMPIAPLTAWNVVGVR